MRTAVQVSKYLLAFAHHKTFERPITGADSEGARTWVGDFRDATEGACNINVHVAYGRATSVGAFFVNQKSNNIAGTLKQAV
jgi:hypothetical protein